MKFRALPLIAVFAVLACGQTISFTGPLSVAATNPNGASFIATGTITQNSTISINVTGLSCEQGSAYCTNAAGVVVVAGSTGVGGTSSFNGTFGGTTNNWNFGALLLKIETVGTVQIFPANSTNGLGSGTPPSSLSLPPTTLSALGFPNFSQISPQVTLFVADTNYGDNSGGFAVNPGSAGPPPPPSAPIPGSLWIALVGLVATGLWFFSRSRQAA